MKILVTGGNGNIGSHVVTALLTKGYQVAIFDCRSSVMEDGVEMRVGDLRNKESVAQAVRGIDAVIHLAAVLPPVSEKDVEVSAAVNVTGTENLVTAMKSTTSCRRLIFASTTAVHGSRQGRPYPITANEPFNPPDNYAKQKVQGEGIVRASKLDWTILRVPAVPPTRLKKGPPGGFDLMLKIPVDARIEVLHPDDAGAAFANAVDCAQSIGKALFIGGGRENGCQLLGYDFTCGITTALGMGRFPRSAFGTDSGGAHAEWLDTTESQYLLQYQRRSFQELLDELKTNLGLLYYVSRAAAPITRAVLAK